MTKLSRKQKTLILAFSTLTYAIIFLIAVIPLFDKSYVLKDSDIFKLDSLKILSRAYYLNSSKGATKSGLEFEDLTLKTFQLEGSDLDNPEELKSLFDTLQFSKTILSIYTDKEGLTNYRDENDNNKIRVLTISIGDKSFGNLNTVNANTIRKLTFVLIISTITYGLFLLIYFNKSRT